MFLQGRYLAVACLPWAFILAREKQGRVGACSDFDKILPIIALVKGVEARVGEGAGEAVEESGGRGGGNLNIVVFRRFCSKLSPEDRFWRFSFLPLWRVWTCMYVPCRVG